jgi:CheY-like chemotaxis protein
MHNTQQTPRHNILLVEDNQLNQMLVLAMLKTMPLSIDVAEDGEQALNRLQQKTYDLILMDCQMPILDGLETTKIIRQNESNKGTHTPIIAVTANTMIDDCQKCLDAGMDDYISKPFSKHDLAAGIGKWLL